MSLSAQVLLPLVLPMPLALLVLLQLRRARESQTTGDTHRPVTSTGNLLGCQRRCVCLASPFHFPLLSWLRLFRRSVAPSSCCNASQWRRLKGNAAALLRRLLRVELRQTVSWQRGDALQRALAASVAVLLAFAVSSDSADTACQTERKKEERQAHVPAANIFITQLLTQGAQPCVELVQGRRHAAAAPLPRVIGPRRENNTMTRWQQPASQSIAFAMAV